MTSTPANCPSSALDLWADEVLVDPFPVFRQLRDLGQVVFLERQSLYALPRFAEVRSTLSSWSRFSSAAGVGVDPTANSMMPESIIKSDPPRHDFHRRTLAAQLSVGSLASATHPIEQTAMQFVDAALMAESFDAVADLARPYSLTVVCDLVGIREEDRAPLPGLAEHAFNIFGPGNERLALAPPALQQIFRLAVDAAEPGKLCPGGKGEELRERGELYQINAYTWPGIDTTVNALGAAIYLFARNPDQWELVRNDLSLIPGAFHEVLRMHSPVQYFTRRSTEDASFGDVVVPADSTVLLMYGSANRDERRYPDADRFDVSRNPVDELAFGRGIHLCVGINLAKMEAHTLLAELAGRIVRFELEGEPEWLLNNTLHGLRRLRVRAIAAD